MQSNRFQIIEEVGCSDALGTSGLEVLLMESTPVLLPLASLILYSREYEQDPGHSLLTTLSEVDIYIFQA